MMLSDDQYFLLFFIMGTYFGPDLKGERTQKSASQRRTLGLPPYTREQLAGSHLRTSEIEQIYYFLTRKADKSLVVKVPTLHQFIQGNHPSQGHDGATTYPSFSELFPPDLHPQTESLNQSKIIADIVFIRNPAIFHIKPEHIERFKDLTRLEDLFIENTAARLPNSAFLGEESDDEDTDEVPILTYYRGCQKKRRMNEILRAGNPLQQVQHCNGAPPKTSYQFASPQPQKRLGYEVAEGPSLVVLPSRPRQEVLDRVVAVARNAYALTGSAAKGQVGSVIGLMDIGESEDSYLFRVALPGVKRENRAFQCEVESDGKVLIKGETITGERRIKQYEQTFVMQTQNLCPSGPFSVLFRLPGPVDPLKFTGSFGTDGILEGIVMKQTAIIPT